MASAAVFSLIDEFTYLVKQLKFHLPYVEELLQPIFDEFSVVQSSLKFVEEDTVEWNLVKEFEGIVREVKTAIVNHALSWTARRRRKTLFKRYALCKRGGRRHSILEIHELRGKLAKLTLESSLRNKAAGESSQENRNDVAEEELSSHQGKLLSDWLRSSADYHQTDEEDIVICEYLKHDVELLKARLLDKKKNHLCVISVFGIQGIGKTVLAWEVYKSSDVGNYFTCKAWVCVSAVGNHDNGETLKNISKQVSGLPEDQETTDDGLEGGLQNRLFEFLRNKRYLIVIDDVPGTEVWNDLKEAFPDGQNGSRIVLTTRDAKVACLANSDGIPHRLWVLSPADSWELFTGKVFIAPWQVRTEACPSTSRSINLCIPPPLVAIGRKMVKKCKGIPLLIIGLVDLLSSRPANISGWSSVLHGADMRVIADDATHRWLNLSGFFDDMMSSHVKQRLPYIWRLFPTDEIEIPTRRFILSWAAEGLFFGQRYSEVAEEEVAHDCLQQLIHFDIIRTVKVSSNGNAKTCSIPHDLPMCGVLRTNKAGNSYCDDHRWVWFYPPENMEHTDHFVHPHLDHDNHQQQQQQQQQQRQTGGGNANPCETLCSLWCFNFRGGYEAGQDVGFFLQRCISEGVLQFLGVLDLEGVDKPCLPEAIGELINLRYLGLRETYLDTLPSNIGKLLKLQTLDTKHTYVRNYPRSVQKLKKLRHLHLNELQYSSELLSRLSQLSDLRTLSGIVVEELDLVKKKDYGLRRLTNLRKLRFTCQFNNPPQQKAETVVQDPWLEGLEHLHSLKVSAIDDKNQLATIADLEFVTKNQELTNLYLLGRLNVLQFDLDKFPKNLTALTLSGSLLTEDPMAKLQKLPKLQFLRLFFESFKGQNMVCSSRGFGQLRVLRIWKLEELEKLTLEEGAMPNIEELEIRSCNNLKELSRVPETLNELKFTKMPEEFTKEYVKYKVCRVVKD